MALIGCGEVGGSVFYALNVQKLLPGISVRKICVQNPRKIRRIDLEGQQIELIIPREMFCEAENIVNDSEIDVVVDATASDITNILVSCMLGDKHIVSANKALIATRGTELIRKAEFAEVAFLIEACVQGKIPILRLAQYHLPLEPLIVTGLFSGTCGYVLSQVENDHSTTISLALDKAKALKYVELDPSADVLAFDAVAKAKIIARCFFGAPTLDNEADGKILRLGILNIPVFAFHFAASCEHRVQLVGTIEKYPNDKIGIVVMPSLVPRKSFLGNLHGVTNGLVIQDKVGPPAEYAGPGAGGPATAAAVLGDLATVARAIRAGTTPEIIPQTADNMTIADFDEVQIRPVFFSSSPENQTGVFRSKLEVIERHGLSVEQIGNNSRKTDLQGNSIDAIVCERASISHVLEAKSALQALSCVHGARLYNLEIHIL